MAAISSNAVTGDWATGGTWVGGVPPTALDTATIVSGANVTVSTSITVGSKASGIGVGVSVPSGGTLTIGTTGVLTVRGFDTTTNNALTINQNGNLVTNAGSTILVDSPSDWGTTVKINGNWTDLGGSFSIPTSNITWNNAATSHAVNAAACGWDILNGIYCMKLNTAADGDLGPISNFAGTGIGSFGDSSFAKSSGGFSGTNFNPVASFAAISANGDFYLDHDKGFVYYKSSSQVITITFTFSYGKWPSYGITCQGNTTQSAQSLTNTTISYAGLGGSAQSIENSQGALMFDDKFSPAINAGRGLSINGLTFNHCTRPLHIYNTNTAGTATTLTNPLTISNLKFNNCHFNIYSGGVYNFAGGLINHGYTNFVNYSGITLNSWCPLFSGLARNGGTPVSNINVNGVVGPAGVTTGHGLLWRTLPNTCQDSTCSLGTGSGAIATTFLNGFGGANDFDTQQSDGVAVDAQGVSGHLNIFDGIYISNCHRVARIGNFMTVQNVAARRSFHHGIVGPSNNGYIGPYTLKNVSIFDSFDPTGTSTTASPGGYTSGYNQALWIDGVTLSRCTFDGSNRSLAFNDFESNVSLVTRFTAKDCIFSNNQQGIILPAGNATNVSSLAISEIDYINDYSNSTNVTNIKQGTFIFGGVNYNTSSLKTAAGCYLFNPSYTLPATANNFVLTVAGAPSTGGTGTKSVKGDWGGGTQVEFVAFQGTASSATNPAGGPVTLTDTAANSSAGWTTSGSGLKAYQVILVSGTGAGQYGMISSNTGTVLTIIPNQTSGNWAVTPDATTTYIIIKPHQTLTDSGSGTISCGIHSPELQLANSTYTDSTITIVKNYPGTSGVNSGINPTYVSTSDFHPTNTALANAASDGIYIGALPIAAAAFEADAFENDAFVVTFGGNTYNVSITSGVSTGFTESVFLGSFPSLTAAITAGFTSSARLDAVASTTFGIAVTNAVSSILNSAASLNLAASVTITSSGGASYLATITLSETNSSTTSASLGAAGVLTLPITVTISDSAQMSAVASVPFPVTTGYALIAQLLIDAANTYNVTTGITDAVTKTAQGSVAFGATTTISDTSKLDAVASVLLAVTEVFQVSLGSIISAAISLATSTGISINTQLLATALVTAAISCGYSMSTKLDGVAQASIDTHPLVQTTCSALFSSLVQAGISTTLTTLVVKQLNAAIVLGATLGLVENGTLFSFEEGALSAGSSDVIMTLVASTVSVVEKLVAESTQVKP